MSVYDIIPNQVELKDVRDTLNFNGGVAGDTVDSLITQEAKINKWSKKKPVALTKDSCQDIDSSKNDYYPNWYKGGKGDCGLSLVTSGNVKDAAEAGSWSYVLPKGGKEEPFRLGDFRGYNVKAKPFLLSQYPKGAIVTAIEKSSLNIVYTLKDEANSLSLSDFDLSQSLDFDDCVMYAEVWDFNKTKIETYQNGYDVIKNGENLLEFNPAGLAFGNHKLLLGLKSQTSGRILPIPYSDDNYYEFTLYYRNLASMLAQFNFYSIYGGSNTVMFSDSNAGKEVLKVTSSNNFKIVFKVSVPDQGVAFQVPDSIYVNTNYTPAKELFTRQEAQSTVQPGQEVQFTYTGLIRDLELSDEAKNVEIIVTLASQEEVGRGYVEMKL